MGEVSLRVKLGRPCKVFAINLTSCYVCHCPPPPVIVPIYIYIFFLSLSLPQAQTIPLLALNPKKEHSRASRVAHCVKKVRVLDSISNELSTSGLGSSCYISFFFSFFFFWVIRSFRRGYRENGVNGFILGYGNRLSSGELISLTRDQPCIPGLRNWRKTLSNVVITTRRFRIRSRSNFQV